MLANRLGGQAVGCHPPLRLKLISRLNPGAAYCFVPDLSRSEGSGNGAVHVKRVVIVDRLRLLYLFKASNAWDTLTNWALADAMSTEYEAAV